VMAIRCSLVWLLVFPGIVAGGLLVLLALSCGNGEPCVWDPDTDIPCLSTERAAARARHFYVDLANSRFEAESRKSATCSATYVGSGVWEAECGSCEFRVYEDPALQNLVKLVSDFCR